MQSLSIMKSNRTKLVMASLCGLLTVVRFASAQHWIQTTAPTKEFWRAVASSADGSAMVAAGLGGIYRSTNSGATWTPTSAPAGLSWFSIASSADGSTLAAGVAGGRIYISTNGGVTWKSSDAPSNSWQCVACSADGIRQVAVYGEPFSTGGVFTSTNAGANWIASAVPTNRFGWYAVASSADGAKLAAMMVDVLTPAGPYGWIYISTNAGATWEQSWSMAWPCHLACSADGTKLVAAKGEFGPLSGWIITSTNSGATWVRATTPAGTWTSAACSADGTRLVAAIGGYSNNPISGPVYTSTDSGTSWAMEGSPTNDWAAVASSADGGLLVAAVNGGGIYVRQTTIAPVINIYPVGTNLLLSWLVPSSSFVLQENSDLTSTNWTDVPTPSVLNFTTLNYQVTVAPTNSQCFYRLRQQ